MRKELEGLSEGLVNIGFDMYEAIMESIEDSIDANAHKINIEIFNKDFTIEVGDRKITSNRISYLITDNGDGIENLNEVFNFGKHKENRFLTIEDLKTKNGIYHYGIISHLNVGLNVTIYTKLKDSEWRSISVYYDENKKKAMIDEEKVLDDAELKILEALCKDLKPSTKGSIIYVEGVSKDNINEMNIGMADIEEDTEIEDTNNQQDNNEEINKILRTKIGIKYKVCLENATNPIDIYVNKVKVKAQDLFLQGEALPEDLRTIKAFANYTITLGKIMEILDDNIKYERLFQRYGALFESEEKFLEECITIDLYALSKGFKTKSAQIEWKNKGYLIPSTYYSGLFVRRNNIYIGNTAKIMNIFNFHPSFNQFRGEIKFSPIFDEFFEIQINKNKYRFSNVLERLIQDIINADNNLVGSTAKRKISNALEGKFNLANKNKENEKGSTLPPDIKEKIKKYKDDLNNFNESLINYMNTDILGKITRERDKLSRDKIEGMEETEIRKLLEDVNKEIKKYKRIHKKVEYDFMSDFKWFKERVENVNERKKLKLLDGADEKYNCMVGIREPENEAEMYGILEVLLKINSKMFEFSILDYDYKNSLDNIIQIEDAVYTELKMKDRFDAKEEVEDINDLVGLFNTDLDITEIVSENKYCFMEMKMELPGKMNHPMRFVSHIVCWDKNNTEIVHTEYVNYEVNDTGDMLLVGNEPRVKIVYLKELLETKLKLVFE